MVEDFSRSTKISMSLYFGFPFSCLRDCGLPCFINDKMIFHHVQHGNSYTAEGVPLHLSISLVNSKSPAKLLLSCVCKQTLKTPARRPESGWLLPLLFIQLFTGEIVLGAGRVGRHAMQTFDRLGQRQLSGISSAQQSLEKIAHCLKSYCASRAAENGEGVAGFLLRANDRP